MFFCLFCFLNEISENYFHFIQYKNSIQDFLHIYILWMYVLYISIYSVLPNTFFFFFNMKIRSASWTFMINFLNIFFSILMVQCCHIEFFASKEIIKDNNSTKHQRKPCSFWKLVKVYVEEAIVAQASYNPVCVKPLWRTDNSPLQQTELMLMKIVFSWDM